MQQKHVLMMVEYGTLFGYAILMGAYGENPLWLFFLLGCLTVIHKWVGKKEVDIRLKPTADALEKAVEILRKHAHVSK